MSKNRDVISKSKSHFTKVPNRLWQLGPFLKTPREKRAYHKGANIYLLFAGSGEGFDPGVRYIVEKLGYSKDSISEGKAFLVCKNMLRLLGKDKSGRDLFEFIPPNEWKPDAPFIVGLTNTTLKNEDTAPSTQGHQVSSPQVHNNERPQKTNAMNDDDHSSSFSKKPEPQQRSFSGEFVVKNRDHSLEWDGAKRLSVVLTNVRPILFGKEFLQRYPQELRDQLVEHRVFVSRAELERSLESEMGKRFASDDSNPKFRNQGKLHMALRSQLIPIIEWYMEVQELNAGRILEWFDPSYKIAGTCDLAYLLGRQDDFIAELNLIRKEGFGLTEPLTSTGSFAKVVIEIARLFVKETKNLGKRLLFDWLQRTNKKLEAEFARTLSEQHPDLMSVKFRNDVDFNDEEYQKIFGLDQLRFASFQYGVTDLHSRCSEAFRKDTKTTRISIYMFYGYILENCDNQYFANLRQTFEQNLEQLYKIKNELSHCLAA